MNSRTTENPTFETIDGQRAQIDVAKLGTVHRGGDGKALATVRYQDGRCFSLHNSFEYVVGEIDRVLLARGELPLKPLKNQSRPPSCSEAAGLAP